jgi:hypothetical protein
MEPEVLDGGGGCLGDSVNKRGTRMNMMNNNDKINKYPTLFETTGESHLFSRVALVGIKFLFF